MPLQLTSVKRFGRSIGLVALSGLAAASAVVVSAAPATAAEITVTGCVIDGVPLEVTIDDEILGAFDGAWIALHTATDTPIDHALPVATNNEVPPICIAPVRAGEIVEEEIQWAWCTDIFSHVCAEAPQESASYEGILDADQAALVAWVVSEHIATGVTTTSAMQNTQYRVWCVTNEYDWSGADWDTDVTGATDCAGYLEWLQSEILPALVTPDDYIDIAAPSGAASPGDAQVFTVSSSLTELEIAAPGASEVELCGDATGATLVGGLLSTTAPDVPVDICVTRGTEGAVTLTATSTGILPLPTNIVTSALPAFDMESCQIFFTDTIEPAPLSASASAEFASEAQVIPPTGAEPTAILATLALLFAGGAGALAIAQFRGRGEKARR